MSKHKPKFYPFDRRSFIAFVIGFFIFVGFLSATFLVSQSTELRQQAKEFEEVR